MKVLRTVSELKQIKKDFVLSIGNFDGVHLGHRQILTASRQTAAKRQKQLLVMTFEPHPLAVLFPEKAPGILTPLPLKEHLLAESGVDYLFVSKSTPELLSLSAEDFVRRFLIENIKPALVVEGRSFNFGAGRSGSIQTLQSFGTENGFEVSVIQAKEVTLSSGQTVKVSSTLIRKLLAEGKVADAAVALGRPYRLIGRVIPGKGKGKQLGFPTANMEPPPQLVPAEGVYAGHVEIGDNFQRICAAKQRIPSVFSIGRTQTLGSDFPMLIEAHLLTKNPGDLLDKYLAMDFIKHLRNQQKFETEKDLSAQIQKDCQSAEEILAIKKPKT